ncbi:MAG: hypothetical protein L7T87_00070 [Schleiferiaceae bacterium]|nr:hypothetical protein [Schleiferiaceae bacterium]
MANTDAIADLLINAGKPDKDSSTALMVYKGSSLGTPSDAFQGLLEDLTSKATQSSKKEEQDAHRRCMRHVLNSLIQCMFRFEWLALPTNPTNFEDGAYLNGLGFSRRRMQRIVDALCEENIMYLGRKGYRDLRPNDTSKASQYYPTTKFIKLFSSSLYSTFGDFSEYEPLKFDRFESVDMPSAISVKEWQRILTRYTEFMSDHTWAMKNPSSRSLKDFVGRGGRINNYYQNLVNRRIPLRTSTLIDGEAIVEPDFSCNHLRMASYIVGEELPADPYSDIAKETGLSRDKIKTVITKCFGAVTAGRSKGKLLRDASSDKRSPMSADDFRAIRSSIENNYPWIAKQKLFFNDVGTRMQWLEGEIALKMLQWATEEQIPLLAVHDAFAVRSIDGTSTNTRMLEVWKEVVEKAKNDSFLEATQYTVAIALERKKALKALKA